MPVQNYKNHARYVPVYHFFASLIFIICIAASSWNLVKAYQHHSGRLVAAILFGLSYGGLLLFWYTRSFAIKAQDRAIRSEENLRHFALTGKLLDKRLSMSQIIALRFAEDTEFLLLSEKSANDKVKSAAIKKSIINWRPDHYRV